MKLSQLFQLHRPLRPVDYGKLLSPALLFPILYFPYSLFWRRGFALLVERLLYGEMANPLRLLFTGNNTILLFWMLVTGVVMLLALWLGCAKLRPWYHVVLYLAVMFSLCGILSLGCYTLIIG